MTVKTLKKLLEIILELTDGKAKKFSIGFLLEFIDCFDDNEEINDLLADLKEE